MLLYCRSACGSAPAYGSSELNSRRSLPSPYPSSRFARLGNGLGYFLPRLTALHSCGWHGFVASGHFFERGAKTWWKLREILPLVSDAPINLNQQRSRSRNKQSGQ